MKKKTLCVFILIFWLMGAVTFLSIKIEEQMIPQVTTIQPQTDISSQEGQLPSDCLVETEEGEFLFTIYEGSGWEAGTRVQTFSGVSGYTPAEPPNEDYIMVDNIWSEFVWHSSKPIQNGELVEAIRTGEQAPDYWLAVFPNGLPELGELPQGIQVEEQSGQAVLFQVEKASHPYMEGQAKGMIPALKEGGRIYSFTDMSLFLQALPALGLLLAILVAALLLWAFSCFLSKESKKNQKLIAINLIVGLLLLVSIPLVLQTIELPSSMLPRKEITDFGHYIQEFQDFFSGLQSFAPQASAPGEYLPPNLPKSEAGRAIITQRNNLIMRPALIVLGGMAFAGVIILMEKFVIVRRSIPKFPKGKKAQK